MNPRRLASLFFTSVLFAACAAPESDPGRPVEPGAGGEGWSGSKLYARDGSVIGGDSSQDGASAAPRDLEPSEGGRMYILELYQKAIDERDALELELRSLQAELDGVRASLAGSERDLVASQSKLEQLAAENRRLLDENVELAARLTTAQIRRLQVERVLLESRLRELQQPAAQPAAAPAEPRTAAATAEQQRATEHH